MAFAVPLESLVRLCRPFLAPADLAKLQEVSVTTGGWGGEDICTAASSNEIHSQSRKCVGIWDEAHLVERAFLWGEVTSCVR